MRKVDLQQQAVTLIRQLSTEKLKSAIDYLVCLQDAEARNVSPDHEVLLQDLGTAIHEMFKERAIHDLYRTRHETIIYDDDYGIWTEQDQNSVAAQVFELFDKAEN